MTARLGLMVALLISVGCADMRAVERLGREACEAAGGRWKSLWEYPYGRCDRVERQP